MARKLFIFRKFLPNNNNGIHYISHIRNDFLEYVKSNFAYKEIDLNNYRINTNTIKINDVFSDLEASFYTYAIDVDIDEDNISYWRCFYIKNFDIQSGYVIFSIEIDLWQTYIYDAKLNNTTLLRSNRLIPNNKGYFDEINFTITETNYFNRLVAMGGVDGSASNYGIKYLAESDARIAFLAKVITQRNTTGTITNSITQLFCIDLSDIRNIFDGQASNKNAVELAIDAVSHIYAIDDPALVDFEVEVMRAWIVTKSMVQPSLPQRYYPMKSKPYFNSHNNLTFNAYFVGPSHIVETKTIEGQDYNINYKYFAGVYGDGLPLKNEITKIVCEFEYVVTESEINISIMQGDRQKDITNNFEVSLSGQAQNEDAMHKIAYWAHNISNMLGMVKSATTAGFGSNGGGGAAALLPASQYVLGLFDQVGDARPSGTTTKGGGASTFAWYLTQEDIGNRLINYPFYLTRFKSMFDEKRKCVRFGANYFVNFTTTNSFYDLANEIDNYDLIFYDPEIINYSYIKGTTNVTHCIKEACNYIENKLSNGIYFIIV